MLDLSRIFYREFGKDKDGRKQWQVCTKELFHICFVFSPEEGEKIVQACHRIDELNGLLPFDADSDA